MTEKLLGKIDFAEYGKVSDSFLFGLQLGFTMNGYGVCSGAKYTINISSHCRWEKAERQEAFTKSIDELHKILNDAKVNYVSELVGKPVEVAIENSTFKDFRILTEVL